MTQTTIYISVIRGNETLALDGNLYLFEELLTILNNTAKDLPKADIDPTCVDTLSVKTHGVKQGRKFIPVSGDKE